MGKGVNAPDDLLLPRGQLDSAPNDSTPMVGREKAPLSPPATFTGSAFQMDAGHNAQSRPERFEARTFVFSLHTITTHIQRKLLRAGDWGEERGMGNARPSLLRHLVHD